MNEIPAASPASDDPKPARPQLFGAPAPEGGTSGTAGASLLAAIDGSASRADATRPGKSRSQWLFAGGLAVLVGGLVYAWAQSSQPSAAVMAKSNEPAQPAPAALPAPQPAMAQAAGTAASAPATTESSAATIVAASDINIDQPAAASMAKPAEASASSAPSETTAAASAAASASATNVAAAQAASAAAAKDHSPSSRPAHKTAQAATHKDKASEKKARVAHATAKPTVTATSHTQRSSGTPADKKTADAVSSDADLLAAMLPYLRRQPAAKTASNDKKPCDGGDHAQAAEGCAASATSAPSR